MASNFRIRYHAPRRIVRIHFLNSVGLADRLQAAQQVVEKFRHLSRLRILVDLRYARSSMSSEEVQTLADFIVQHDVLRRARIAVLFRLGYNPSAPAVDKLARRGQHSRHFLVESEAMDWLQR